MEKLSMQPQKTARADGAATAMGREGNQEAAACAGYQKALEDHRSPDARRAVSEAAQRARMGADFSQGELYCQKQSPHYGSSP